MDESMPHNGSPYLVRLPRELQELIFSYLDNVDLKALRLTSKSTSDTSTTSLFFCFTLYSHKESFQRMAHIAASPHLARHVHEFTYDPTWIGVALDKIDAIARNEATGEIRRQLNSLADRENCLRLRCDTAIDGAIQALELTQSLSQFINLDTVKMYGICQFHSDSARWMVPGYQPHFNDEIIERFRDAAKQLGSSGESGELRKFYADEYEGSSAHVNVLLMALSKVSKCTRKWHISGDLEIFAADRWNMSVDLESKLSRLESLTITDVGSAMYYERAWSNMQSMLKAAMNLSFLSLTFAEGGLFDDQRSTRFLMYSSPVQSVFFDGPGHVTEPRLTWSSNLKELHLRGLRCTASEFEAALSHCASTLRILNLNRFVLMPSSDSGPRSCLVHMFKWIQSHIQLEKVELWSSFRNQGLQDWILKPVTYPPEAQMHRKLQEYIMNGGECPIEHLAIQPDYFDLHCVEDIKEVPDILLTQPYKGEPGFHINYEEIRENTWELEDLLESSPYPLSPDAVDMIRAEQEGQL